MICFCICVVFFLYERLGQEIIIIDNRHTHTLAVSTVSVGTKDSSTSFVGSELNCRSHHILKYSPWSIIPTDSDRKSQRKILTFSAICRIRAMLKLLDILIIVSYHCNLQISYHWISDCIIQVSRSKVYCKQSFPAILPWLLLKLSVRRQNLTAVWSWKSFLVQTYIAELGCKLARFVPLRKMFMTFCFVFCRFVGCRLVDLCVEENGTRVGVSNRPSYKHFGPECSQLFQQFNFSLTKNGQWLQGIWLPKLPLTIPPPLP